MHKKLLAITKTYIRQPELRLTDGVNKISKPTMELVESIDEINRDAKASSYHTGRPLTNPYPTLSRLMRYHEEQSKGSSKKSRRVDHSTNPKNNSVFLNRSKSKTQRTRKKILVQNECEYIEN